MGNKKFATELRGKTVMTNDGKILGVIENFVVDTKTGTLQHVLVVPAEEVDPRLYKTDSQGRLVLPFTSMRSVRDVVVMDLA
jgi:sporulation protein YlmC with PRC-barrel domain